MSQPEDVSVSGDGNTVAVADTGNNRVRLYTIKGQQLSVVGMRGKGNGQFDLPLAVVITPANLLVVGERNNARLQVLRNRVRLMTYYEMRQKDVIMAMFYFLRFSPSAGSSKKL